MPHDFSTDTPVRKAAEGAACSVREHEKDCQARFGDCSRYLHVHCVVCDKALPWGEAFDEVVCSECDDCPMCRSCAQMLESDFEPKPLCPHCAHDRALQQIVAYEQPESPAQLRAIAPITTPVADVTAVMQQHLSEVEYGAWLTLCDADLTCEIADCDDVQDLSSAALSLREAQDRIGKALAQIHARKVALTTLPMVPAA